MKATAFWGHYPLIYSLVVILARAAIAALFLWLAYRMGEHMSEASAKFWKGVLSDNSTPSWSRVASSLLLLACIYWDTLYELRAGKLPDAGIYAAQALFIVSPYGINVSGKAAAMLAGRPPGLASPTSAKEEGAVVAVAVGK